ncbi:hypothetical protein IHQ71_13655 [Rhizobium sp. TH2]|nr:hypothetical protein [Rhizobium sp. TH2]UVC11527.1 hypothetical protein IHQ71_13655 [Rhizobium sp. TH2]
MIRSGRWEPQNGGLATYAEALKDHAALPDKLADIHEVLTENETDYPH